MFPTPSPGKNDKILFLGVFFFVIWSNWPFTLSWLWIRCSSQTLLQNKILLLCKVALKCLPLSLFSKLIGSWEEQDTNPEDDTTCFGFLADIRSALLTQSCFDIICNTASYCSVDNEALFLFSPSIWLTLWPVMSPLMRGAPEYSSNALKHYSRSPTLWCPSPWRPTLTDRHDDEVHSDGALWSSKCNY